MNEHECAAVFYKAIRAFCERFHYTPNHPNELDFNVQEYAKLLEKCIADGFDYTIEKYGTPAEQLLKKRQPGEMIWD